MIKFTILASGMTALILLGAQSATAASARSIAVSYGELNLSHPAGREILMRRIHNAAQAICGDVPTQMSTTSYRAAYRSCERATVHRAIASLPDDAQLALRAEAVRTAAR